MRIAQRLGIHDETSLQKHPPLDKELHRRLWWQLVFFDSRICELGNNNKSTMLTPIWNCNIPLNVGDSDLRNETKTLPKPQAMASDGIFVAARGELGEYVRNSDSYLAFVNPVYKSIVKPIGSLDQLEARMKGKYLRFCDLDNPLHFMTTWAMRGYLARYRLIEYYSKSSSHSEAQRRASVSYAMTMIECDTEIMASPLTKGFVWFLSFQFPFPAYIHLFQELKQGIPQKKAEEIWEAMGSNYEARFSSQKGFKDTARSLFQQIVLQAWESFEEISKQTDKTTDVPRIVALVKEHITESAQMANSGHTWDDSLTPLSGGLATSSVDFDMGLQNSLTDINPLLLSSFTGQNPGLLDGNYWSLASMGWGSGSFRGW